MCELASEEPRVFPAGDGGESGTWGQEGPALPGSSSANTCTRFPLRGRPGRDASCPPRDGGHSFRALLGQSHGKGAPEGPVGLLCPPPGRLSGIPATGLGSSSSKLRPDPMRLGACAGSGGAAPRRERWGNRLTPKSCVHPDKVPGLRGCWGNPPRPGPRKWHPNRTRLCKRFKRGTSTAFLPT